MESATPNGSSVRKVLGKVDVKPVTETIIEQLEESILSGQLAVGDKLPPEHRLAEQAGVGRRAIREALKALELKGLVSIRKGSGAFVVRNDFDNYMDTLVRNMQAYLHVNRARLIHILQFRELLTEGVIGVLSVNPDPEGLEKAETANDLQIRALEKENPSLYTKAHIDYHMAIINGIHNPVVAMMYAQVIRLLEPYMKASAGDLNVMRRSIAEHREILDAIKAADTERAIAAHRSHMASSFNHLQALMDEEDGAR